MTAMDEYVYMTRSGKKVSSDDIEKWAAAEAEAGYDISQLRTRPKVEPNADARNAARAINEMFVALIDEGMEERVAIATIGNMLANAHNPDQG